jgi:high affinity Mn2+ porin
MPFVVKRSRPTSSSRRVARAVMLTTAIGFSVATPRPCYAQQAPLNLSIPQTAPATVRAEDWSIHVQYTLVGEGYPRFRSRYQGTNSLPGGGEVRETMSQTTYLGRRLWDGGELYFNPEFNQGFGLADTRGLAGFPNGEAQKAGQHVPQLNIARLYVTQTFGLGGEQEFIADDLNQIAGPKDISRITVYVGKLAVNDIFDNNNYAHDTRNDFMNWSVWEGGAYDYAADQKGYSDGLAVDFNQKEWAFRFGYFLEPKFPNSRDLDTLVFQRGGYQAEIERRYMISSQRGTLRVLGFVNRALMGNYSQAVVLPDINIDETRKDRLKTGFVINLEQAINDDLGVFARFSYNDGSNQITSFTDIDRGGLLGISLKGSSWGRPNDVFGLAGVVNALSRRQADFLAAGGLGILVGDGKLTYGTEDIIETYYRYQLTDLIGLTADYQLFINPGYNEARGPVSVFTGRLHFQF